MASNSNKIRTLYSTMILEGWFDVTFGTYYACMYRFVDNTMRLQSLRYVCDVTNYPYFLKHLHRHHCHVCPDDLGDDDDDGDGTFSPAFR